MWHFGFLFILFLLLFSLFGFLFILYLEFVVFSLPGGPLLPHPKKIHTLCSLSTPNRKGPRRICAEIERHCDNPTIEQAAVVIPVAFKYFVKFLSLFIFSSGSQYSLAVPLRSPRRTRYPPSAICVYPDPYAGPLRICSHFVASRCHSSRVPHISISISISHFDFHLCFLWFSFIFSLATRVVSFRLFTLLTLWPSPFIACPLQNCDESVVQKKKKINQLQRKL